MSPSFNLLDVLLAVVLSVFTLTSLAFTGRTVDAGPVSWASSDVSVVTVSPTGVLASATNCLSRATAWAASGRPR